MLALVGEEAVWVRISPRFLGWDHAEPCRWPAAGLASGQPGCAVPARGPGTVSAPRLIQRPLPCATENPVQTGKCSRSPGGRDLSPSSPSACVQPSGAHVCGDAEVV